MKLISNQISPNLSFFDGLVGLWHLITRPKAADIDFSPYFGTKDYLLLNNARAGLKLIAQHYPTKNKTVGIPAFICSVVAIPFISEGYQVEWIDVDDNGLIDKQDCENKIRQLSILICPHIFGQNVDIKFFHNLCTKHNVLLIEDCAHYCAPVWEQFIQNNNKLVKREKRREKRVSTSPLAGGIKGGSHNINQNSYLLSLNSSLNHPQPKIHPLRLLSFGREKDFSCVSGGALVFGNDTAQQQLQSKILHHHSLFTGHHSLTTYTLQHLLNPLIYNLALPWWHAGGKILPMIAHQLKLLPKAVTKKEKQGKFDTPIHPLPHALQVILKREFDRAQQTLAHRHKIAQAWKKIFISPPFSKGEHRGINEKKEVQHSSFVTLNSSFSKTKSKNITITPNALRVIIKQSPSLNSYLLSLISRKRFHLRDWDGSPIAPKGTNLSALQYTPGQCPNAEKFSQNYLTLPTHQKVTENDIKQLKPSQPDS